MDKNNFIGVGRNPHGPDLPLGLGMQLAQDPKAMETFGKMSNTQKSELIGYIQGAATGDDAKMRIRNAVSELSGGKVRF